MATAGDGGGGGGGGGWGTVDPVAAAAADDPVAAAARAWDLAAAQTQAVEQVLREMMDEVAKQEDQQAAQKAQDDDDVHGVLEDMVNTAIMRNLERDHLYEGENRKTPLGWLAELEHQAEVVAGVKVRPLYRGPDDVDYPSSRYKEVRVWWGPNPLYRGPGDIVYCRRTFGRCTTSW